MNIHSVSNRGLGLFCVTLRSDPIYQKRAAARVSAGRADHLLKFAIEEELKPRGKRQVVSMGRFYIVYPDHDADPNLKPDIHTPEDWKRWEVYLRSRERRLKEDAGVTNAIVVARSRFLVLDQLLQPGVARERFVRRWRQGKVGNALEIMILRIADIMDVQRKRRALRIVMIGRFYGDPMSRDHEGCSPPCEVRRQRQAQNPSSDRERAASTARGRTGKSTAPKTAAATPSPGSPGKARPTRPTAATEPESRDERVVQLGGQDFVQDPDIGDGPEP